MIRFVQLGFTGCYIGTVSMLTSVAFTLPKGAYDGDGVAIVMSVEHEHQSQWKGQYLTW